MNISLMNWIECAEMAHIVRTQMEELQKKGMDESVWNRNVIRAMLWRVSWCFGLWLFMQTFFLQDILTSDNIHWSFREPYIAWSLVLWTAWLFILVRGIVIKLIWKMNNCTLLGKIHEKYRKWRMNGLTWLITLNGTAYAELLDSKEQC